MNKTTISILAALAAIAGTLTAEAKFSYGIKAGLNVDKLGVNGSHGLLDSDDRCGVTAGVTAEYIAPVLGLGADISVMYTHMKSALEFGTYGGFEPSSGNFIELPLHLKYMVGIPAVSSVFQPYFFTGPSMALKLSGENSYFASKTTQWGWDLGLGVQLINHLQVGAGYTFGINNVAKVYWGDQTNVGTVKFRNNYWTVTAAWMF